MPARFNVTFRTWVERIALILVTSLFHHYPMPTFVGAALMLVVGLAVQKPPAEYRDWK